jgi:hypothetical protein
MIDYRFYKNILLINPSGSFNGVGEISSIIDEIKPEGHVIIWQPWEAFDDRFLSYLTHDYVNSPNHPEDFQNFENILVKNNVKCYLLVGCDYSNAYSNIKTNPLKNFEVLFWPTALLHYTFYGMNHFYGKTPSELFNQYKPIDRLYLNLNNHERSHRAMLLDYLCKFDLFNYGINTWQNVETSLGGGFQYFTPRQLSYDDFNDKPNTLPQRVFSEKILNAPNLIDIIGETYPYFPQEPGVPESIKEFMFHTEKTFKSILFGKPFLIFGAKGQNLNLHKYEFALYNIFDYRFDNFNYMRDRCLGIIDNLYSIKNKNFGEVRDNVMHLSRANIDRATDIVYNDEYIPSQLKTLIKENKDEYKILLRDFDSNYAGSFGLPDKWSLIERIFKQIYQ